MTALTGHCRTFVPAAAACTARQRPRQGVTCRMGGPMGPGFDPSPGAQPGRLYIPGQDGGPRQPGKLVIPSQGSSRPGLQAGMGAEAAPTPAGPAYGNFRPPPGFMDAVGELQQQDLGLSPDDMIARLRTNAGHWHQLAKLLPALARAGYDSMVVEELVGLERSQQNVWTAAEQVYESVKKGGELSPAEMELFDSEGGEYLLYELRFLSIKQRSQAAKYIAQNELSPQEALVLARAVKDHERRDGTKEGFSGTPGDCLAYKYYRDAIECRRKEDAEACVQKGLSVAVTDTARAKLAVMMGEQEVREAARPTAVLTTLRLTKDELGNRIVCVAGSLQECSVAELAGAPKASAEGVFGNFRVPSGDYEWVALPNWSILMLAGHPVGLSIANCADVPEIVSSSFVKTEEELKRLVGSGLLVVDLAPEDREVDQEAYYLIQDGSGRLRLQDGEAVVAGGAEGVVGVVLFLARTPARDGGLAGSTAELLSL